MSIIPQLGGYVCIRNGESQDYCYELAIGSLLNVCSEVVVLDSDSTDGTKEHLQRMALKEPRIKLHNMPWSDPKGVSHNHWVMWLNEARKLLSTKFQITLDGDEFLDDSPECHQAVLDAVNDPVPSRRFRRNNYWKSPSLVAPDGTVCGRMVVRMGPASDEMPSDQPAHPGEYSILDTAKNDDRLLIHHLGFLREKSAFYRKAKSVLGIWFNRYDPRLETGEKEGKQVWETECEFTDRLEPVTDHLPDSVQFWLAERGHQVPNYLPAILEPEFVPRKVEVVAQPQQEPMNVLHSGDLGDLIHGLSVFKAIGAVNLFVTDRSITKRIVERLPMIETLLRSQFYIRDVRIWENEPIHWNASEFRQNRYGSHQIIAQSHAMHYRGQGLPAIAWNPRDAWLTGIAPDWRGTGRVIIHRSPRYHTHRFPWRNIVEHCGEALLFVGYEEEHQSFCREFGEVEYLKTNNLLETARLIAVSVLVIANQSSVLAVAEGMKHPRIVEICPWQPDVIFPASPWAQYVADGIITLPPVNGHGVTLLHGPMQKPVVSSMIPPDGWEYPGIRSHKILSCQVEVVARMESIDKEAAKAKIVDYNGSKKPDFFKNPAVEGELSTFRLAVQNASML